MEGGKRRGGGSVQGDSLYIKGQEGEKRACKSSRQGRGLWWWWGRVKVETITFSFGQVFLCVHACKRERGGACYVQGE